MAAKDTLVGILGVVLIVGSMATFIEVGIQGSSASEEEVRGPPAAIGTNTFTATECRGISLFWTPPLSALQEASEPWTPAPGPLPDRGLFWLFAFECPNGAVDGLSVPPPSGAGALILVEEPEDPRNVSAPDGWIAVPQWIGDEQSKVTRAFDRHGFTTASGSGSVGVQDVLAGTQVRMVVETSEGRLEASSVVSGEAEQREVHGALLATNEERFGVFSGPEEMERRTTGSAVVQTSGTTWVERLDLEPSPYQVAYKPRGSSRTGRGSVETPAWSQVP